MYISITITTTTSSPSAALFSSSVYSFTFFFFFTFGFFIFFVFFRLLLSQLLLHPLLLFPFSLSLSSSLYSNYTTTTLTLYSSFSPCLNPNLRSDRDGSHVTRARQTEQGRTSTTPSAAAGSLTSVTRITTHQLHRDVDLYRTSHVLGKVI